jgi:hypothetical protein
MSEKINVTTNHEGNISEEVRPELYITNGIGRTAIGIDNKDVNQYSEVIEHQKAIDSSINSIVKSLKQEVYGSENLDISAVEQILNYLSSVIVEMRTVDPTSEKATFFDDQLSLMRESLRVANITGVFNRNDFIPPLTRLEQYIQ